jgi:hypothetical protein
MLASRMLAAVAWGLDLLPDHSEQAPVAIHAPGTSHLAASSGTLPLSHNAQSIQTARLAASWVAARARRWFASAVAQPKQLPEQARRDAFDRRLDERAGGHATIPVLLDAAIVTFDACQRSVDAQWLRDLRDALSDPLRAVLSPE